MQKFGRNFSTSCTALIIKQLRFDCQASLMIKKTLDFSKQGLLYPTSV